MRLEDLMPAVVTILLIGIILGLGIYILAEFDTELATEDGTVTNESGAYINSTGYTLSKATETSFNSPSITSAWNVSNASAPVLIGSGNYTLSEDGVLTNATATTYDDVNVSYTYQYGEEASSSINTTVDSLGDFAGWIAVIVVVIAAAIVLGIVLKSFGSGLRA